VRRELMRFINTTSYRIDVILPALSIENAMMADAALHMMSLQIGPQTAAQLLGGECLAGGTDAAPVRPRP
jgi:hypothetical protein